MFLLFVLLDAQCASTENVLEIMQAGHLICADTTRNRKWQDDSAAELAAVLPPEKLIWSISNDDSPATLALTLLCSAVPPKTLLLLGATGVAEYEIQTLR